MTRFATTLHHSAAALLLPFAFGIFFSDADPPSSCAICASLYMCGATSTSHEGCTSLTCRTYSRVVYTSSKYVIQRGGSTAAAAAAA